MSQERCTVTKFGGTSLASANQFKKVKAIIESDASRRYVVPSAPGKRFAGDRKVTDLLIDLYEAVEAGLPAAEKLAAVRNRFEEIRSELGLTDKCDLETEFKLFETRLGNNPSRDYVVSRGEYFNALLLAAYLEIPFIDAAEVVFFDAEDGLEAELTNRVLSRRLSRQPRAVIPGFYGSMPDGALKTFSRGGSDITGSLVARAANADLYENWTDVSGFLAADPRIVDAPRFIETITYRELRELSYMGASVLHEDATFPVKWAGIPIRICNTEHPEERGTSIVPVREETTSGSRLIGIAGRDDLCVVHIEKDRMDAIVGYAEAVMHALASQGIAFHHLPAEIDALDVILTESELKGKEEALMKALSEQANPDRVRTEHGLALFAAVGTGLPEDPSFASGVFAALSEADIPVRMISNGYKGTNLIIGVPKERLKDAVRAVYGACS